MFRLGLLFASSDYKLQRLVLRWHDVEDSTSCVCPLPRVRQDALAAQLWQCPRVGARCVSTSPSSRFAVLSCETE